MVDLPKEPVTRQETYLSKLAGENTTLPREPITREEMYLDGAISRVEAVEAEVEEIKNNPDVVDIVATYADLQSYDKKSLTDKDIIRVLADENHDGDSTYYRYSKSSNSFTYIGESKQYTAFVGTDGTTAGTAGLVPAPATTDAGKVLGANGNWVTGGPTVVQTTGTSTTDVMSQNAVTNMVFGNTVLTSVRIGKNATVSSGAGVVAIGGGPDNPSAAHATGDRSIAIGGGTASGRGSVIIGVGSSATQQGQFDVSTAYTIYGYNNSNYRLLTGLYDPQSAHDAATKGYVDGLVGDIAAALNAINNGGGN